MVGGLPTGARRARGRRRRRRSCGRPWTGRSATTATMSRARSRPARRRPTSGSSAFDTQVLEALGAPVPPDDVLPLPRGGVRRARRVVGLRRRARCARRACRTAGLRLAVISNWGWAAPELLHTLELARHFEARHHQRPGRLPEAIGGHLPACPGAHGRGARAMRSMSATRCRRTSIGAHGRGHPAGAHRPRDARSRRCRGRWPDARDPGRAAHRRPVGPGRPAGTGPTGRRVAVLRRVT